MAEITRRRTGELLRNLFQILKTAPEGLPARVALERLAEKIQLTDYEAGMYESGSRRFDKIVRFATVDCVKAGWLLKNKGTWIVTDAGLEAYTALTDPEVFYKEAVRLYHVWKKTQANGSDNSDELTSDVLNDGGEKSSSITFEQAEEQAWTEIEAHIGGMDPYEFQKLVADLLKAMGYYASWIAPPGKDGGVDIVAYPDPLGTRPPRIKVQVKRQQQRINADGVRSFVSLVKSTVLPPRSLSADVLSVWGWPLNTSAPFSPQQFRPCGVSLVSWIRPAKLTREQYPIF